MILFPYVVFFFFFLFLRTFLVLRARNWLTVWLFLELNLLVMVPLIVSMGSAVRVESGVKYFVAQAVGRLMILLGIFSRISISYYCLARGVSLKLGLVPLHFWFPSVLIGARWVVCGLLITWQKIPLLMLLLYMDERVYEFLMRMGLGSAILGGVIGINQVYLRPLLGYSSIRHRGWVVCLSIESSVTIWFYFFIYCVIVSTLVRMLHKINAVRFFMSWRLVNCLCCRLLLLSLGGLPPFRGFAAKVVAIICLSCKSLVVVCILVVGSLFSLYFYLSLVFSFLYRRRFRELEKVNMSMMDVVGFILSVFFFWPFVQGWIILY